MIKTNRAVSANDRAKEVPKQYQEREESVTSIIYAAAYPLPVSEVIVIFQ